LLREFGTNTVVDEPVAMVVVGIGVVVVGGRQPGLFASLLSQSPDPLQFTHVSFVYIKILSTPHHSVAPTRLTKQLLSSD
jgi:hypothetical protein